MGLFNTLAKSESAHGPRPLAERMRPQTLDEFVGQEHLLGPGKPLRTQIEHDELSSMIFWGPPGCGKTTLARIMRASPNPNSFPSAPCSPASKKSKW